MSSKFEEAFYRNKRAALLSSLATIAISALSIRVSSTTQIYGIQIGSEISSFWVVIIALLIGAYLNISYYLYYYTEVPIWARDPEQGIKQAESVRASLDEMKGKAAAELESISNGRAEIQKFIKEFSDYLASPIPDGFSDGVESRFSASMKGKFGAIHVAIFNQLSSAINSIGGMQYASKLNWEKLSDQVVDKASEIVIKNVGDEVGKFTLALRNKAQEIEIDIKNSFNKLAEVESKRIDLLDDEISILSIMSSKIGYWHRAMHFRLNVQYLYFPAVCFAISILYSLGSLYLGVPAHLLVSGKVASS